MQLTNKALIATTIELSLTKQDERGQMAAAACCSHPRRRAGPKIEVNFRFGLVLTQVTALFGGIFIDNKMLIKNAN